MITIRSGTSRSVIIFEKYVIKFPILRYGWKYFIQGILANINEGECYYNNRPEYTDTNVQSYLCDIIWYSKSGLVLIMKKASVLSESKYIEFEKVIDEIESHFPGDRKAENYGIIENRIVKLDYA